MSKTNDPDFYFLCPPSFNTTGCPSAAGFVAVSAIRMAASASVAKTTGSAFPVRQS